MFPELAKYDGTNPTGFYLSEKLNGVRALWNGVEFISKNGNPFAVPFDLKRIMPALHLDGELYANGDLGRIAGLCRRKLSATDEWQGVTFQIFDSPFHTLNFADRLNQIAGLTLPPFCRVAQQSICTGSEHLRSEYERIKAAGGEGLVIKSPAHMFRAGQSALSFKIKYLDDFEIDGCTFDENGRFICVRDYE